MTTACKVAFLFVEFGKGLALVALALFLVRWGGGVRIWRR